MIIISAVKDLFARLWRNGPDQSEDAATNQAWSLSARLASVPAVYQMIVPSDLAELVREAKDMHPAMAAGAKRREEAVQTWLESAAAPTNSSWVAHAYPLQQVTIRLQGTRHSDRAAVIQQLEEVIERLRAGDTNGEVHDDDFGYRFEVIPASQGPSFFGAPSARS